MENERGVCIGKARKSAIILEATSVACAVILIRMLNEIRKRQFVR